MVETSTIIPPKRRYPNGTQLCKKFLDPTTGTTREFTGSIAEFEYCKDSQKWMYLIFYPEDGDWEHMTPQQVAAHMREYNKVSSSSSSSSTSNTTSSSSENYNGNNVDVMEDNNNNNIIINDDADYVPMTFNIMNGGCNNNNNNNNNNESSISPSASTSTASASAALLTADAAATAAALNAEIGFMNMMDSDAIIDEEVIAALNDPSILLQLPLIAPPTTTATTTNTSTTTNTPSTTTTTTNNVTTATNAGTTDSIWDVSGECGLPSEGMFTQHQHLQTHPSQLDDFGLGVPSPLPGDTNIMITSSMFNVGDIPPPDMPSAPAASAPLGTTLDFTSLFSGTVPNPIIAAVEEPPVIETTTLTTTNTYMTSSPTLTSTSAPSFFDINASPQQHQHEKMTVIKAKKPTPKKSKKAGTTNTGKSLPSDVVAYLRAWMMSPEHIQHPYPTAEEKQQIMADTGIEMKQLSNWFMNNRKRYWKPRVEAQQQEQEAQQLMKETAQHQAIQAVLHVQEAV